MEDYHPFFEHIFISVTKPSLETKLGLSFDCTTSSSVIVTKINPGPFDKTGLEVGQEIISVNGTILAGLSKEEVKTVFASIDKDLCLEVSQQMKFTRDEVPALLMEKAKSPIPLWKWQMIHDSVQNGVRPAVKSYSDLAKYFQTHMQRYENKQLVKRYFSGGENEHEVKTFILVNQMSIVADSANLVATSALSTANVMLNSHGICVKLGFRSHVFPHIAKTKDEYRENIVLRTANSFGFMAMEMSSS